MKEPITILAIGDRSDYDSYLKFNREKYLFKRLGFDYVSLDYKSFFRKRIFEIKTKKVIIFLFFPFYYWDKYIEHKNYKGIYGSRKFYEKFLRFWERFEKKFMPHFKDKKIIFINDPYLCAMFRDKLSVIKTLVRLGVHHSRLYKTRSLKVIKKKLKEGHKLFIKVRFGSMGKGIVFLNNSVCRTNFIYRDNRIISRKSDYGWKFNNITEKYDFLRKVLKKDIMIQESVESPIYRGDKIDLRIYTFFDKVLYIYPRRNKADRVTTNISQGGRGSPRILKIIPKKLIRRIKKKAKTVAGKLGIIFAGIDIIPENNFKGFHVIDVNLFSGFPKRRRFNLTQAMALELKRLSEKGKLKFKKAEQISKEAKSV